MKWWEMGALSAVLLLCISIIGLSCASSVVVKGGGSDGNGPIPTIDSKPPFLPSPQDPSQYEHPNIPTLPQPGGSTNPNPLGTNNFTNGSISQTFSFSMSSRVVGSTSSGPVKLAGFSEWRNLNGVEGFNAKQASSALSGSLDESRLITFYGDNQESTPTHYATDVLVSRDQTNFLGSSYYDRVIYSNKGDVVRNSFSSGAISKNSTYIGGFEDNNFSNQYDTGSFTKLTVYNLDSRNVGITNLELISKSENDSSEISEQYIGDIAISVRFKNNMTVTYSPEDYEWLPCSCCAGWADMHEQDQNYYNATKIFDCT